MNNENKKHLIFRNLILGLTLLVCIFVAVIAWFATSEKAVATGLTVKSYSGLGLDASFDAINYNSYIQRESTNNFKFSLITGDGTNFFIPSLDRTTGSPLTNTDGTWKSKREAVAAKYSQSSSNYTPGDYYVEDIWFRSDKELSVYLTSNSSVTPLDAGKSSSEMLRKSDYGAFSKDNIAGAARVGFFEVSGQGESETETPVFTWIPNEKFQLTTSDNLTPIPSTKPETGGDFNPNDPDSTFGLTGLEDSGYRLWEGHTDKDQNPLKEAPQERTVYVSDDGTYLAAVNVVANTQVDHAILVTKKDSSVGIDSSYNGAQSHDCYTYFSNDDVTNAWVGAYFDGNKNINYSNPSINNSWSKLVISSDNTTFFSSIDRFQVLVSCSFNSSGNVTELKVIGFVFYNSSNPNDVIGGGGQNPTGSIKRQYSMESGNTVVITNYTTTTTETTYGLNTVSASTNTVRITMKDAVDGDGNSIIVPQNPLATQLYNVTKNEDGTYTFKSLSNGKFLAIQNGKIVLSDTASKFILEAGTTGPMLKSSDGYYISFSNNQFTVSNTSENANLQIYQGSEYSFSSNGSAESTYTYYESGNSGLSSFSQATAKSFGYLLSSQLDTKPVVTLKDTGNSYMAHIRVKIWVEGTDREAEIPLAGGIFSTHLDFQGLLISSS